ncbi:MAG: Gfo/Idh/MocA family oxidoreductase [Caldilineaceae bacterium]|nr:Gfo/Idh/MocA family oxidoreductase [Caldilineaceae bacterium]
MTTYRAGVIGHTGRGNYGHSLDTVYLGMEEIDLVAVADADADGLTEAGERLGVGTAGCYSDYRRMLEQEELDIVSVAPRWLDQKRDMVIAAAASGVRGIFCEKPFARTAAEADAMIAACERAGVKITVSHQGRVNRFSHKMKEMIADGAIGEVEEAHSAGKQDHRGGGQDLMVLGTHSLDMLCFLFGHPRWVQAYIRQDGHDAGPDDARQGDEEIGPIVGDHLQATYGFDEGIVATFSSRRQTVRPGPRPGGLVVHGTEGILLNRDGYLYHCPHPNWSPAFNEPAWQLVLKPNDLGFNTLNAYMVRDLIAAFEEDREPISSGRDARWALEMILGVYTAHRHGRTPLPLADREHPLRDWVSR